VDLVNEQIHPVSGILLPPSAAHIVFEDMIFVKNGMIQCSLWDAGDLLNP